MAEVEEDFLFVSLLCNVPGQYLVFWLKKKNPDQQAPDSGEGSLPLIERKIQSPYS